METYPAKVRTWRDFLTLIKNEGRDDVVVLLDRAVGARRERREGRHHDLRLCVDGAQMIKLAPVATAYISAKHRSVPVVGKSFLGNNRDGHKCTGAGSRARRAGTSRGAPTFYI